MFWEHWEMASSYLIKVKEEPDQLNSQTNMEWFIETSIQYKRYILPLESTLLFISIDKGAPRKRSNSNPDCFVKPVSAELQDYFYLKKNELILNGLINQLKLNGRVSI